MALKRRIEAPKSNSNKEFAPIENLENGGEYEGRLVYVADLGVHEWEYLGENKRAQQIALGIEIVGETIELDGEVVPRLLWTEKINIYSTLTDKGKELVYYKLFEPKAKDGVVADWDAQLGKPINVTIKHVTKGDKTYDNIDFLTAIPAKYQDAVGAATIEPCIGDADDPDNPCTKALYGLVEWIWKRRVVEESEEGGGYDEPPFNPDDDIPF